jgi:hypothetical protein
MFLEVSRRLGYIYLYKDCCQTVVQFSSVQWCNEFDSLWDRVKVLFCRVYNKSDSVYLPLCYYLPDLLCDINQWIVLWGCSASYSSPKKGTGKWCSFLRDGVTAVRCDVMARIASSLWNTDIGADLEYKLQALGSYSTRWTAVQRQHDCS